MCLLLLITAGGVPVAQAQSNSSGAAGALVQAQVIGTSNERGIVALSAGARQGVSLEDPFWVFSDTGVVAGGRIHLVMPDRAAGIMSGTGAVPARDRPASILVRARLMNLREAMAPGVTIRGPLARVPPGRRTAWLSFGASSGLKTGDLLLVSRQADQKLEIPVARARVEQLRADTALVALEPIVSNTLPQPGDVVELWPAPGDRALGWVESTVLQVVGPMITLVGTAEEGLAPGRLVDLFRGDEYVGHASIVAVGESLSQAQMVNGGTHLPPQEGDRARVRPAVGASPQPVRAAIMKILAEGEYAQIAAGETDGLRVGEKLIVRRPDATDPTVWRDIAELSVNAVNVDHATASIRLLTPEAERVRQWDFAERRNPPWPYWRQIGMVERVDPSTRTAMAVLEPRSPATTGTVVRWTPTPEKPTGGRKRPGSALVIHREGDQAVLYVPPAWGEVENLPRALVELAR
ncbi:MAG: hypothetical protein AMXMBFR13_06490 [Phycisphaerae bacterium]